jgi:hypothetical protein
MKDPSAFDTREGLARFLKQVREWIELLEKEILSDSSKTPSDWATALDELAEILSRAADRLGGREADGRSR